MAARGGKDKFIVGHEQHKRSQGVSIAGREESLVAVECTMKINERNVQELIAGGIIRLSASIHPSMGIVSVRHSEASFSGAPLDHYVKKNIDNLGKVHNAGWPLVNRKGHQSITKRRTDDPQNEDVGVDTARTRCAKHLINGGRNGIIQRN